MTGRLNRDAMRRRLAQLVEDARAAGLEGELGALLERLLADADAGSTVPGTNPAPPRRGAGPAGGAGAAAPDSSQAPGRFGMIGDSAPMRAVFDLIARVAPSDVPVLVLGETGTGKELVARAIHEHSRRRAKPFLAENCAAVPENLLESELFGHKRGSFTGAVADRPGHFGAADGGTVFLDEIGDMPLAMQAKLLRVLQEGEVRPVGSNKTIHVDVRIVAATNKDLATMCRKATFREDLYYRLNVITIALPPLRDRSGDVAHLVAAFLRSSAQELGRDLTIAPDALAALERWRWPGNVRELENVVRRAAVFCRGTIGLADLPAPIGAAV